MKKLYHPLHTPVESIFSAALRFGVCLLLGLCAYTTQGQDCTLVCNGTLTAPLQTPVGDSCQIVLLTDNIIEAPQACPGDKFLTVRDSFNNILAEANNLIQFDAGGYVGQVLSVTVTDIETAILCEGFIMVVDNTAPVFVTCPEETVSCVAALTPDDLPGPTIYDNCDSLLTLDYADTFEPADCLSDTAGTLLRAWTATDSSGNFTSCEQAIHIMRPELDSIQFPPHVALAACDPNLTTDPDSLGRPTLDSVLIMDGGLCGFSVTFSDDTIAFCGDAFQVSRTWTVASACTGFVREEIQDIDVLDTIAPVVTCPVAPILVSTDPSECFATILLPQPEFTDNCTAPVEVLATTSYGDTGFEAHPEVPLGNHTVQYTLIDACGNTTECTRALTVVDNEAPTAICEDETLVSIPNTGIAVVDAIVFDDGSSDNCQPVVFYKARRMTPGGCDNANGDDHSIPGYQEWFDDSVQFCCADIGTQVQVILRVYEIDPGPGPVDPTREEPGGELFERYTECMMLVSLQDALPPQVACPADQTIDCATDVSDLSIFGSVTVSENCSFTLDSTATASLDDCGEGTILRTWTATDGADQMGGCTQTITVANDNALTEADIIWPVGFTSDDCGSATDPEDLPEESQYPTILIEGCGDIVYEYEDLFFNLSGNACFKILRTWTVLDWCHYNADTGAGQFTYTQIIKVKDNVAPTLTVPEETTYAASGCDGGFVSIPAVTATDCSEEVTITNDSPFANLPGSNASGVYPIGTTVVNFAATDNCGNVSTASIEVIVVDETAPGAVCIAGLSVSLTEVNGQVGATVSAATFDGGSEDACQPDDLQLTIRRGGTDADGIPTTTEVSFTCADIGVQLVELWATDAAGNGDFCLTFIDVQDNHGLCNDASTMAMIAGGILTENGTEVEHVEVQVAGQYPANTMTGIDGDFMFEDMPVGMNYTIQPVRNDDLLNGVTTIDLILISRHVLGDVLFDSPYKIIAADVDRSGHVSTLDIIRLRKVILGIDTVFPNGNPSWRFVDANYEFPDPTQPWVTYFPESYTISSLDSDEMHADFIAIKVGDVNGSAQANSFASHQSVAARSQEGFVVRTADRQYAAGATITVPVYGDYMNEVLGYQFTLEYDVSRLQLTEITPGDLPDLYDDNFGWIDAEQGLITTMWNEQQQAAAEGESLLFTLHFTVQEAGTLSESLFITSGITRAEAYDQNRQPLQVGLDFTSVPDATSHFELYQNRPNPFSNETLIPFKLNASSIAVLAVYDMAGKQVYRTEEHFDAGYHEIGISRAHLPGTGLFYYTLQAGGKEATRKMVFTD